MDLYFITGNDMKFEDAAALLPGLRRLDIDLPEVQSIDACEVIHAKLQEAFKHHPGPFVVEDSSLFIDCLNGLPGPLVKWFLLALGAEGLYDLVASKHTCHAQARAVLGFARTPDDIVIFEGVTNGEIIAPRGEGHGWNTIFQPEGEMRTYSEMTRDEINRIGQRSIAFEKLRLHLAGQRVAQTCEIIPTPAATPTIKPPL